MSVKYNVLQNMGLYMSVSSCVGLQPVYVS